MVVRGPILPWSPSTTVRPRSTLWWLTRLSVLQFGTPRGKSPDLRGSHGAFHKQSSRLVARDSMQILPAPTSVHGMLVIPRQDVIPIFGITTIGHPQLRKERNDGHIFFVIHARQLRYPMSILDPLGPLGAVSRELLKCVPLRHDQLDRTLEILLQCISRTPPLHRLDLRAIRGQGGLVSSMVRDQVQEEVRIVSSRLFHRCNPVGVENHPIHVWLQRIVIAKLFPLCCVLAYLCFEGGRW